MPTTAEITRLTLQVARGAQHQAHLRVLLEAADTALASHRQELRNLEARASRPARKAVKGT